MTPRRSLVPPRRALLVTYLPAAGFLAATVVVHELEGVDFGMISRDQLQELFFITREQAQQLPGYPLVGIQSMIGGMLWFSTFALAGVTLLLLRQGGELRTERAKYLGSLWALTGLLGVDDMFLVHDELAPRFLGIDERPFTLLYVVAIAALVARFRRSILSMDPGLFLLAVALLAGSVVVDHFQDALMRFSYREFFEDGFKFLGIAGWSAYLMRECWLVISGAAAFPPASPAVASQAGSR